MKPKLFLFYPLLFAFLIFLLDKVFLMDYFHSQFLQTGNMIYYRHREDLIEKLRKFQEESSKKIILGLGDSRSYSYSSLAFELNKEKPERMENYTIYNFSAPQAVPAYSLFILEKILEKKVKINTIFLSLSPEGFDDKKRLMSQPFLRLGADDVFFQKYKNLIPEEDQYEYFLDKVFALRKIELNYPLLLNRLKTKKMNQYNKAYNEEMLILNIYNGEQLSYTTYYNDEEKLKKDSLRMGNIYFYNFEIHDTQFQFLEKILSLSKDNDIHVYLIFPRVYQDYRKNFDKYKLYQEWWPRVLGLAENYGMSAVDFNKESTCDLFYDASHQSTICYYEQINYLMEKEENRLRSEKIK
ncbi:MAG: DUF1574 family protein [Leptospiraceae bacterium]|nr:DUF1574 family protein [Leptospiraceae bacterium]MCP5511269.1 DUF1574 family protein [Leptospiraceae bacterium]